MRVTKTEQSPPSLRAAGLLPLVGQGNLGADDLAALQCQRREPLGSATAAEDEREYQSGAGIFFRFCDEISPKMEKLLLLNRLLGHSRASQSPVAARSAPPAAALDPGAFHTSPTTRTWPAHGPRANRERENEQGCTGRGRRRERARSARASQARTPGRVARRAWCPVPRRGWRPRSRARAPARARESSRAASSRATAPVTGARASAPPDRAASLQRLPQPVPRVGIGTGSLPGSCRRGRAGQGGGRDAESARERQRRGRMARDGGAARARTGGAGKAGSPAARGAAARATSARLLEHLPAPGEGG